MTKRAYWDEKKEREEYQKCVQKELNSLLNDYEIEYADTPFYQNTSNCQLEGAIDELKSIDVEKIDYQGIGCYLSGRIRALEILKKIVIFGDDYE